MIWIYVIIAIIVGIVSGIIFYIFIKNKVLASVLTIITIAIALIITNLALPHYFTWQVEYALRKQNPFMNLVAEKSPNEFNAYVKKIKHNLLTHGNPNNDVIYTSELINDLLIKYGPVASNESIYQYLQSDIDFEKKLLAINPVLVLFHVFPDKFKDKVDLQKYNINEIKNNMLSSVEAVIKSGMEHPEPLPTAEEIAKAKVLFSGIIAELAKKYGPEKLTEALKHPDDPSIDKKTVAEIVIDLSEATLAKGKDDVGLILKAAFLAHQQKQQNAQLYLTPLQNNIETAWIASYVSIVSL